MNEAVLRIAIGEAERFLANARTLLVASRQDPSVWGVSGNRWRAAVRRSSLDLTRALADLRRRETGRE